MKTLPKTFRKNTFDYELVKRNTCAAIFAQKSEGILIAYEVVKIKIYPTREVMGGIVEAGEYYPTTANWGIDGFTVHNIQKANELFNRISNENEKTNSLRETKEESTGHIQFLDQEPG